MQDDDQKDDNDTTEVDSDHQIPEAGTVTESKTDEDQFEEPVAAPSVTGGEDPYSDATDSEPVDIDDQLGKLGLDNDEDGVKPLSSEDIN